MSKQIIILITVLVFVFMFFFFNQGASQKNKAEIADAIQKGALLVDVRTEWEFAEGSVPGAINIPLDKITSNLDKFKNQTQIIVFCRSGNRSGQAKAILEKNGFTNVINGGTWTEVAELVNNKKR